MNLETKITIYKFTPQVFTLAPKLYKNSLLKFHWIAENFYRFFNGKDAGKTEIFHKLWKSSTPHFSAYCFYIIVFGRK